MIAETALQLVSETETTDRNELEEQLQDRALLSARSAEDSKLVDRVTLRILDRQPAE